MFDYYAPQKKQVKQIGAGAFGEVSHVVAVERLECSLHAVQNAAESSFVI